MITAIIKIGFLMAIIIIPLIPRKEKKKANVQLKICIDTSEAEYAINEQGALEKINQTSLSKP